MRRVFWTVKDCEVLVPQQTVYIRNGDMDKWKALENKAAFISEHLNGVGDSSFSAGGQTITTDEGTASERTRTVVVPKKVGVNLCKIHLTPLTAFGKCLMKGCKYAW